MDEIRQLLGRIAEQSDQEVHEPRDTILAEFDAVGRTRAGSWASMRPRPGLVQGHRAGPGPSCAVFFHENHWRGLAAHHTMAASRDQPRER
jgi:hypothetical protein